MGRGRVSGLTGGDRGRGHSSKASRGLRIVERDDHWHVVGTIRVDGHRVRLRRSTGLPAGPSTREDAEALRDRWAGEVRREVVHGVRPSVALGLAARDYLHRKRARPLNAFDVSVVQELTRKFGTEILSTISGQELARFVDRRQAGNKPQTRERYIDAVLAFLNWCATKPRYWLADVPAFDRNREARASKAHQRRRVSDLRPDLVALMIEHAGWHLRPQLAVAWSTGARVSSIVHGARLCDVSLAQGREQIRFLETKNGEAVTAALHPFAAEALRSYLERRGHLDRREEPLFLTPTGRPYSTRGRERGWGGQNKTAFRRMRLRTVKTLLRRSVQARRSGHLDAALLLRQDARLVATVTPHWFRHLLATTMLANNVDIRTIMTQGGWKDLRSVMRYAHDVPDVQRRAVASLRMGAGDTHLTRERPRQG